MSGLRNSSRKDKIIEELYALGVKNGDLLFLSADLMKVGYFNKNIEETLKDWVEILLDVVGESGTIIIPANTDTFNRFQRSNNNVVFSESVPPNSGSLSMAFFKYADVIRSKHPSNSCFGIGPLAKQVLDDHDENSLSYSLYGKIIDLKGKNLMLGTAEDMRNSPMPFHYCQEKLGHTLKHPSARLHQCYYYDEKGTKRLFTRRDVGGCTRGAINTFGEHIANKAIKFGRVGKSLSALVDTERSYDVLFDIFKNRPYLIKCSDKTCISCYGRFMYNGMGVVPFYFKKIPYIIKKIFRLIFKF